MKINIILLTGTLFVIGMAMGCGGSGSESGGTSKGDRLTAFDTPQVRVLNDGEAVQCTDGDPDCFVVQVDCVVDFNGNPVLDTVRREEIKVRLPAGPPVGYVLLNTGEVQTNFYGKILTREDEAWGDDTVDELVALGYMTFDPKALGTYGLQSHDGKEDPTDGDPGFDSNKISFPSDHSVGYRGIYCTTSAIVQWIEDNWAQGAPFCATGNSGGGSGIAYGLTRYGSDAILDYALISGGPPMSDLQATCFDHESNWSPPNGEYGVYAKIPDAGIRLFTDEYLGYGYAGGACSSYPTNHELPSQQTLSVYGYDQVASIDPGIDLDYPIRVDFMGAVEDQAVYQGMRYSEKITSQTGRLWLDDDPRTPNAEEHKIHKIFRTYSGHEMTTNLLVNNCAGGTLLHTNKGDLPGPVDPVNDSCDRTKEGAECAPGQYLEDPGFAWGGGPYHSVTVRMKAKPNEGDLTGCARFDLFADTGPVASFETCSREWEDLKAEPFTLPSNSTGLRVQAVTSQVFPQGLALFENIMIQ